MFKSTRKGRLVKVAAATAAIGSIAAIGFAGNSSVNADPKQYTDPIFGFGSDTLQDVTNAFAGFSNNKYYEPLQSGATKKQIVSWDAFDPRGSDPLALSCITTKVGSPQITRPNGSSNGVRALSSANNAGQRWPTGTGTNTCGATRSMGGQVDFARSSGGPSPVNAAGPLVYIPFGRDALSFAYIRPSGSPLTDLSTGQLAALHTTGPQRIGTVPVIACGINTGSGTRTTWLEKIFEQPVGTSGLNDAGTDTCTGPTGTGIGTGNALGRLQENNGPDLLAKSTFLSGLSLDICGTGNPTDGLLESCANAQLIVGFSASQFIARTNGVGTPAPALGANGGLGSIGTAAFTSGSGTSLTPNPAAFAGAYGRDVYYVLAYDNVDPAGSPVGALVDMFVGSTSKVCSATTTIQSHGFLSLGASCGDITLRGNYRS